MTYDQHIVIFLEILSIIWILDRSSNDYIPTLILFLILNLGPFIFTNISISPKMLKDDFTMVFNNVLVINTNSTNIFTVNYTYSLNKVTFLLFCKLIVVKLSEFAISIIRIIFQQIKLLSFFVWTSEQLILDVIIS